MRLRLHLEPTWSQEFVGPTPTELQRSVSLLHRNPGSVAELTYFDTHLAIRALPDHRYLVEYSDPAVGTWVAERRAHAYEPRRCVVIDDREWLLREAQLVTQADALNALEDFLDEATRSGRLALSPAE